MSGLSHKCSIDKKGDIRHGIIYPLILQDAGMKTDLHRLVKSEGGTDDEGNTDQDDSDTHTSSLLLVLIALLIFTGESLGTQQEVYLYYRSNEGNPGT